MRITYNEYWLITQVRKKVIYPRRDGLTELSLNVGSSPVNMDTPHRQDEDPKLEPKKDFGKAVRVLEHASICSDVTCDLLGCNKFKGVIAHVKVCRKGTKACAICDILVKLSHCHFMQCNIPAQKCSVPFCDVIKKRKFAHWVLVKQNSGQKKAEVAAATARRHLRRRQCSISDYRK